MMKSGQPTSKELQLLSRHLLTHGLLLCNFIEKVAQHDGIPVHNVVEINSTLQYFRQLHSKSVSVETNSSNEETLETQRSILMHCQLLIHHVELAWSAKRCGLSINELHMFKIIKEYSINSHELLDSMANTEKQAEKLPEQSENQTESTLMQKI